MPPKGSKGSVRSKASSKTFSRPNSPAKPGDQPKEKRKQTVDQQKLNSYFDGNRGFWMYLSIASLLLVFVFKDFLFLDKLYLFKDIGSDSITLFQPHFYHTAKMISEGSPTWTFHDGMGGPFQGALYYLSKFFRAPLFLSGKHNFVYLLAYLEVVKMLVAGSLFFFFLKTRQLSGFISVFGALLFTCTSLMVLGSGWYNFTEKMVCFAFLLLAVERYLLHKQWWLFPLAVAYTMHYFGVVYIYLFSVFLVVYFVFRFLEEGWDQWQKLITKLFPKIILLGGLGILIGLFLAVDALVELVNSPRVSGGYSKTESLISGGIFTIAGAHELLTVVLRFFSDNILGSGRITAATISGQRQLIPEFMGWGNYMEAPMVYIGLLPLLLFPQAMSLNSGKKRAAYIFFIVFWCATLIFPWFRRVFWAFTGDYYRTYSIFVSLAFLLLSMSVLDDLYRKGKKINLKLLVGTLLVLLIALHYPYKILGGQSVKSDIKQWATVILIVQVALLFLISQFKYTREAWLVLLLLVVIDLGFNAKGTVNDRDLVSVREHKSKNGFNDYTVDALQALKQNDSSFYRINKEYQSGLAVHGSLNDALIQEYYGTTCYKSFQQPYYIKFLEAMGVVQKGNETTSRWAHGLSSRTLMHAFGSIKYHLSKLPNSGMLNLGYQPVGKYGDVSVLKNSFALPLGFSYKRYMLRANFDVMSNFQKDITLLRAFVVDSPPVGTLYSELMLSDTMNGWGFAPFQQAVDELKVDTMKIDVFEQDHIAGRFTCQEEKMLFFTIPFDEKWKLWIDGKEHPVQLVNIGFMGVSLPAGDHKVVLAYQSNRINPIGLAGSTLGIATLLLLMFLEKKGKKVWVATSPF